MDANKVKDIAFLKPLNLQQWITIISCFFADSALERANISGIELRIEASQLEKSDWAAIFLPMAYGLAILYQPAHPSLSAGGRERLDALQSMVAMSAGFFEACEQSYLKLYLYGEHTQNMAQILARDHQHECAAHQATLTAYNDLQRAHRDLLAKNRR